MFPIIGRMIAEEYEHHHRHVTAREIAARLLAEGEARAMIDAAQQHQPDWSQEHTASNLVAWFSQCITVGEPEWQQAFYRTKIDDQWAYKPASTLSS